MPRGCGSGPHRGAFAACDCGADGARRAHGRQLSRARRSRVGRHSSGRNAIRAETVMSGTEERLFATDAREIAERAAEWIVRRSFESWSTQDQADFDAWLAQSLAHEIAFLRMEAGWSKTERLTALRSPERTSPDVPAKSRSFLTRAIVTLLAIAALGGAGAFSLSGSVKQDYSTPIGGHRIIAL